MTSGNTFGLCLVLTAVAACGGSSDNEPVGGNAPDSGASDDSASGADAVPDADGFDSTSEASADGCGASCGATCCSSDEVCCLDSHGHNPACVNGLSCPPPLVPADAGP